MVVVVDLDFLDEDSPILTSSSPLLLLLLSVFFVGGVGVKNDAAASLGVNSQ